MAGNEYPIKGTIKSVKGKCSAGHKVGNQFNITVRSMDGLCAVFAHDLFPWVTMLAMGGTYPWSKDKEGNIIEWECCDPTNRVTIELQRIKDS